MNKTNKDLVAHCEMALKQGWYYLWGASGQIATQAVLNSNIKQYPDNERWRSYATKAIGKTRFCDCYGLVKSCLWWRDDQSNPGYIGSQDVNTSTAYAKAAEKGPLSTLPELPGIVLWMQGHVGVYMGNGRFIECAGGGVGMSEGRIVNGVITRGSKFTNWFKDVNIEYVVEDTSIQKALQVLVAHGVVTSSDYWLQNYDKVPYLNNLILNMAAVLSK